MSILQNQELPRVQPVYPHAVAIFFDNDMLVYCGINCKGTQIW